MVETHQNAHHATRHQFNVMQIKQHFAAFPVLKDGF
jgi:hypothetical protein